MKLRILCLVLLLGACDNPVARSLAPSASRLDTADAALRGGSAPVALQITGAVLANSPNNVQALEIQGDALTVIGQYDAARSAFETALQQDPSSDRARIGLGRLLLSTDPARAEKLFLEVHQRNPRDTTALNNLGVARDLQGHHEDAQLAYRQALGISPDLNAATVNLALSLSKSRRVSAPATRGSYVSVPSAGSGAPIPLTPAPGR